MYVKRIADEKIFEVKEYVRLNGEENVWCDGWNGRHIIRKDCELIAKDLIKEFKESKL